MTAAPDPFELRFRTDAERDAFAAATAYAATESVADPPENAYMEALPIARSLITRRLLRGLLRGAPESLPQPAYCTPTAAAATARDLVPALENAIENTLEAESLPVPDSCEQVALLPFPNSTTVLAVPIDDSYGYGRLRLAAPLLELTTAGVGTLDHPIDVVALIRHAGGFCDAGQAEQIHEELAESTANLALATVARRVHRAAFDRGDTVLGLDRTSNATAQTAVSEDAVGLSGADAPAALERLVTDGHPLHPSAKIRRGMSPTAGVTYAPPFTDSIDLRFVAVHTDRARETSIDDRSLTDRLYSVFDGLSDAVTRAVPGDPAEYAVLPIHPWQFYHVLPDRYERQRAAGTVVPVPAFSREATPLLNLRTVVPYAADRSETVPHCKLAIGVQLTNVERTVSPQAVHNGPRVTRLLREIGTEAQFSTLGVVPEPAATCYYPPGSPHVEGEPYDDVRHLSGLLRSNPRSHRLVSDDARLVPAATLVATSPVTGEPLVHEAVDSYAAATDTTDFADAARSFLEAYVAAVVPDQLRLLSGYGIALESHLQNSAVVFEDGRPIGTLVRDFGGVRIHEARLADRGLSIELYPDSDLDADDERDCYRKLYYALFQNHLTELIVALVESTPIEADDCWSIVREHCQRAFETVQANESVPNAQVDRDAAALFADPATHKALTTMRLEGKRHEYATSAVPNPLCGRLANPDRL